MGGSCREKVKHLLGVTMSLSALSATGDCNAPHVLCPHGTREVWLKCPCALPIPGCISHLVATCSLLPALSWHRGLSQRRGAAGSGKAMSAFHLFTLAMLWPGLCADPHTPGSVWHMQRVCFSRGDGTGAWPRATFPGRVPRIAAPSWPDLSLGSGGGLVLRHWVPSAPWCWLLPTKS